jgi:hypothetical protein
LLVYAGLVGAFPVWIYISWMKLNTIDDNKRKFRILYIKVRGTCSPLTGVSPDVLADVESTEIGPLWLLQTLYLYKSYQFFELTYYLPSETYTNPARQRK